MSEYTGQPRLETSTTELVSNTELIADLCRFKEAVLSEAQVRRKWRHLDNAVWDSPDEALIDAVEAESIRRVRSGASAREKAQLHHVQAPDMLNGIMTDAAASARNRIESAKELRAVAATGPENAPAMDRFVISIVLNGDVEHYDKPIAVGPDDSPPILLEAKIETDSKDEWGGW
jgi:hypothetical protein